ncbi:hypothetical protein JCM3775_003285 [Rhodotorula graminis]
MSTSPPPTYYGDVPHKRGRVEDDDPPLASPANSTGRLADRFQTLARISAEVLGDDDDEAQAIKRRKIDEQGDKGLPQGRARGVFVPRQASNVRNCDGCRTRKTKCDRSRPCGNCRLRGKSCTYSGPCVDPFLSMRLDKNLADITRLKQHAFMLARRLGLSQDELEDLSRVADQLFEDEAKRTMPPGMWLPSKRPLAEVLCGRDAAPCVALAPRAAPTLTRPHEPVRAPASSTPAPPPPPPRRYGEYDVAASWSSLQQAQPREPVSSRSASPPPAKPSSPAPPPPPRPAPKHGDNSAFTSVPLEHAPRLFGPAAARMTSTSRASGLVTSSPASNASTPHPPPRPTSSINPIKWSPPSLGTPVMKAPRAAPAALPPLAIPALAYRSMHLSSAVTSLSSAASPLGTASTAWTTPASAAPPSSSCTDGDRAPTLPPFRLPAPRSSASSSPPSAAPKGTGPRLAGFASLSAIAGLDSPGGRASLSSREGEGPSDEYRRSTRLPPLRLPPMQHADS